MNIQDKPDYKVFASEARSGEVTDFPNLERGWGETIDKTEKIPPMEWFNLVGKRADEWLLYLTQRGVAEWDFKVKYPQYAMCQLGGRFYIATAENENKNPANSQTVWVDLAKYLGVDGKLDSSRVVQTTGQSTTSVMSQKAITDALVKKLNISDLPANTAYFKDRKLWRCGDTGFVVQWGFVNSSDITSIAWNEPFDNEVLSVAVAGADSGGSLGEYCLYSKTRFGAKVKCTKAFTWIAIGY